jgi:hypothetical protein
MVFFSISKSIAQQRNAVPLDQVLRLAGEARVLTTD